MSKQQIPDTVKAFDIGKEGVKRGALPDAQVTKELVTVKQRRALCAAFVFDEAAHLTGTALPVDGGWTAH